MMINNRYNILEVLGEGSFGKTFLAEDTQMPSKRRCVVKQLKLFENENEWMANQKRERFQKEAKILEDLGKASNHRIPELYAHFAEGNQFYLVQEFIDGQTLLKTLQMQKTLPEIQVKQLLASILPVLDFIHRQGVIHRDIKPENIVLRGSNNEPVLIDFGAFKETLNAEASGSGTVSIGTHGYMPIEQFHRQPVFSSDLYALGMTAITALTGKSPVNLQRNPHTDELNWREYSASVSLNFADVLNKAIATNQNARYTSAAEMLTALQSETIYSGSTVQTPPPAGIGSVFSSPTITTSDSTPISSAPTGQTNIQPSTTVSQNTNLTQRAEKKFSLWDKMKLSLSSGFIGALLGAAGITFFFVSRSPNLIPEVLGVKPPSSSSQSSTPPQATSNPSPAQTSISSTTSPSPEVISSVTATPTPVGATSLEGNYSLNWVEESNKNANECWQSYGLNEVMISADGLMQGSGGYTGTEFSGKVNSDGTWTGSLKRNGYVFKGTFRNGELSGTYTAKGISSDPKAKGCQGKVTGFKLQPKT